MKRLVPVWIGIILFAGAARAEFVTSLPESIVIPIPPMNYFGGGPQVFGEVIGGVTWTSTNLNTYDGSAFGYTSFYAFGANGTWNGALGAMAGLNSPADPVGSVDTMTFEFETPVSGVGGYMNYHPGFGNPVIAVYDSGNNLIERQTLNFNGNGADNSGSFYGFLQDRAIIKYFRLSNSFIGITNLSTTMFTSLPPAPMYSCLGFEPPIAGSWDDPVKVKHRRVLPLKAQLEDGYGSLIIGSDISSPPRLRVLATYTGETDGHDVTDGASSVERSAGENRFVFTSDGKWQFNLVTRNFTRPGSYSVSLTPGDGSEYRILEPTCRGKFVIE